MNRLAVLLMLALVGSGVGLIYTEHYSRQLFMELQALQAYRDDLEVDWEMLQLEQSTLATETVVDQAARNRLEMQVPDLGAVVYVIR